MYVGHSQVGTVAYFWWSIFLNLYVIGQILAFYLYTKFIVFLLFSFSSLWIVNPINPWDQFHRVLTWWLLYWFSGNYNGPGCLHNARNCGFNSFSCTSVPHFLSQSSNFMFCSSCSCIASWSSKALNVLKHKRVFYIVAKFFNFV